MYNAVNYAIYISLSVFITIFVSHTLSKNGLAFLVKGFRGNIELATSTNHLLVVGFYLINLGFVLLRMQTTAEIASVEDILVYQAEGIGLVLLILGLMHLANMFVIYTISKASKRAKDEPPSLPADSKSAA